MITIQLPLTTSIKAATKIGAYLKLIGVDADITTGEILSIEGMLDPGKNSMLRKIRTLIAEAG